MNIAIAGASDIGFHLAKLLSFEAQDITLIDADKELLNYADNNLDLRAVKGDPSALATLKLARYRQQVPEIPQIYPSIPEITVLTQPIPLVNEF